MAGTNGLKMGNKLLEWEAIERDFACFWMWIFLRAIMFQSWTLYCCLYCLREKRPTVLRHSIQYAPTGKFKRQYCLHLFLVFIHFSSYFINFYRILINWQQTEHFHQFDGNLILWWRLPLIETNQVVLPAPAGIVLMYTSFPLSHLWRDFCTSF